MVPAFFLLARRVYAHARQPPQDVFALGGIGEAAPGEAREEILSVTRPRLENKLDSGL